MTNKEAKALFNTSNVFTTEPAFIMIMIMKLVSVCVYLQQMKKWPIEKKCIKKAKKKMKQYRKEQQKENKLLKKK